MAIKTFTTGEVLTASDTNTYLANAGLVYVTSTTFSSVTSVSINSCFTTTYDNYRVIYSITGTSAGGTFLLRLRKTSSDATSSYSSVGPYYYLSAGSGYQNIVAAQNTSYWGAVCGSVGSSSIGGGMFEFFLPNVNTYTMVDYKGSTNTNNTGCESYQGTGVHFTSYQADGFTLFSSGSAFNFSGTITVYGYRKA